MFVSRHVQIVEGPPMRRGYRCTCWKRFILLAAQSAAVATRLLQPRSSSAPWIDAIVLALDSRNLWLLVGLRRWAWHLVIGVGVTPAL